MNILFLMISMPSNPNDSNLYSDLAFEYAKNGHDVTIIAGDSEIPESRIEEINSCRVLRVRTWQQKGVRSVLKKGLAQVLLPWQFRSAYKKHLSKKEFDAVFMPTPPITLTGFVNYVKKNRDTLFYLILRDIYPQGAADLGLVRGKWMYDYLRRIEIKTYLSADIIGCMSTGNVNYIANNNPYLDKRKLKLLPNWQKEQFFNDIHSQDTEAPRKQYGLDGKFNVLFGGTIGYAQKVENIILLGEHVKQYPDVRIVVIGQGVKKQYLVDTASAKGLDNIVFIDRLPRETYLNFAKSCDLGLITIDERFTVPTIPSKMVAYFNLGLPVLAVVDAHTDFPEIIKSAGAGLCSIGGDNEQFFSNFDKLYKNPVLREEMSRNGYDYFKKELTVEKAYQNSLQQILEYKNEKDNSIVRY